MNFVYLRGRNAVNDSRSEDIHYPERVDYVGYGCSESEVAYFCFPAYVHTFEEQQDNNCEDEKTLNASTGPRY